MEYCGKCVVTAGCGYCLSSLQCMEGNEVGPTDGLECDEWLYTTDEVNICPSILIYIYYF